VHLSFPSKDVFRVIIEIKFKSFLKRKTFRFCLYRGRLRLYLTVHLIKASNLPTFAVNAISIRTSATHCQQYTIVNHSQPTLTQRGYRADLFSVHSLIARSIGTSRCIYEKAVERCRRLASFFFPSQRPFLVAWVFRSGRITFGQTFAPLPLTCTRLT